MLALRRRDARTLSHPGRRPRLASERSPLVGRRHPGAPAAYGRAVPARGGGDLAPVLALLRLPGPGPRDRPLRPPRRRLGARPVPGRPRRAPGRGGLRPALRRRALRASSSVTLPRRAPGRATPPTARTRPTCAAGTRDRMWPDPNDEADGRGAVVSPRLVEITRDLPRLDAAARRRGAAHAGRWLIPPEQDSPLGPAFQPAAGTPRPSPPPPAPAGPTATRSASATAARRR